VDQNENDSFFEEQLSRPDTHNDQDLDNNGDRASILVEPVNFPDMSTDSDDKSTCLKSSNKNI